METWESPPFLSSAFFCALACACAFAAPRTCVGPTEPGCFSVSTHHRVLSRKDWWKQPSSSHPTRLASTSRAHHKKKKLHKNRVCGGS
ncbi:hypothetical protein BC830DRAFT_1136787 [Chytriomyces sp. MP71]|nr:hypothetical protein BC830DRAFT_1136787 [Chytriomyces sp. MP71]